ncbi:hypothetical protein [Heterosigma akashiwo virus 01]|jgi:hypothetical protein|uniref:Uncharacterized protein n=1 Tax=Heterosigma akashiwo virus 01 TaxID=97195 RepID=A0A1C9C5L5_HAV01|nr:hypothetical protein D1R72_gp246 [Heterosigma akashiwo virus 01]AOM63577.1 hypothetical protein [Heterosigma akashiwo virus 01]
MSENMNNTTIDEFDPRIASTKDTIWHTYRNETIRFLRETKHELTDIKKQRRVIVSSKTKKKQVIDQRYNKAFRTLDKRREEITSHRKLIDKYSNDLDNEYKLIKEHYDIIIDELNKFDKELKEKTSKIEFLEVSYTDAMNKLKDIREHIINENTEFEHHLKNYKPTSVEEIIDEKTRMILEKPISELNTIERENRRRLVRKMRNRRYYLNNKSSCVKEEPKMERPIELPLKNDNDLTDNIIHELETFKRTSYMNPPIEALITPLPSDDIDDDDFMTKQRKLIEYKSRVQKMIDEHENILRLMDEVIIHENLNELRKQVKGELTILKRRIKKHY